MSKAGLLAARQGGAVLYQVIDLIVGTVNARGFVF
jgi:hypothetical protein